LSSIGIVQTERAHVFTSKAHLYAASTNWMKDDSGKNIPKTSLRPALAADLGIEQHHQ